MDDLVIETRDLTKEFAGFTAVQGVDLRVRRGSIHALIGPNGAGKTRIHAETATFEVRASEVASRPRI